MKYWLQSSSLYVPDDRSVRPKRVYVIANKLRKYCVVKTVLDKHTKCL
jgi:hypothetical protein